MVPAQGLSVAVARRWIIGRIQHRLGAGAHEEISGFSLALFVSCMFCHGELARTKTNAPQGPGNFYLMIALGGALGGTFVAVAAPNLVQRVSRTANRHRGFALFLALALVYGVKSKKLIRLGVVACSPSSWPPRVRTSPETSYHLRNFYGAGAGHRIPVRPAGLPFAVQRKNAARRRISLPPKRLLPTTYYGPESGAGALSPAGTAPRTSAIVGLGVGTLAAYGRAGDSFRYYEINPAVIRHRVATTSTSSMARAQRTDVITGDGRLALEKEPADSFDVLVLDAFSDDTIPVHLMTKEAFGLYFRLSEPDGALAIHLTNRYHRSHPVVDARRALFTKASTHIHSREHPAQHILEADWAGHLGTSDTPPAHAAMDGRLQQPLPGPQIIVGRASACSRLSGCSPKNAH